MGITHNGLDPVATRAFREPASIRSSVPMSTKRVLGVDGRVRDGIGGRGRRLEACSVIAGGKSRRAGTPPPDGAATKPPDPEGVVYVSVACAAGRLCDPYRVEWNWRLGFRGRRPASAGLAHGYCRSAFQAASAYGAEAV